MACEVCDHTLSSLAPGIFWCERCGSVKGCHADGSTMMPKLVERCRSFGETLGPSWRQLWHRLGIDESIHKPEDRTDDHHKWSSSTDLDLR